MSPLPFPLDRSGARMHAWGRNAVWSGAGDLGLREGDEVLVPAYHHGSEIEALHRRGLVLRFYGGDPLLRPDPAELEALAGERTRVLYLVHYLGFPQDAARWRAWSDERGLLLVEDAAQTWLATAGDGRPVGSHGDLAIFCIYKSVGLPEGALSIGPPAPPQAALDRRPGVAALARRHGAWTIARSRPAHQGLVAVRAPLPVDGFDHDAEFGLRDPEAMPWATTNFLLRRLVRPDVATLRRRNFAVLAEALGHRVPPPFDELPAGAAPFALPVRTTDKGRALEHLLARGVAALDLWSRSHPLLPRGAFPALDERRATTIGLPVHQELRTEDLERIADATLALDG